MPVLPSATTTLSGIAAWSQPVLDGLLPYGYLEAGVILAVGLVTFLIVLSTRASHHMKK